MYRLRDIADWLTEEGVRARISLGRTTNMPIRHVTLIPTGGGSLSSEGVLSSAGLQVICREADFNKAEDLAQQIDRILVPYDPLDAQGKLWIGADTSHMTHIVSTNRQGGEPALVDLQDAYTALAASYLITAARRSRPMPETGGG